MKSSALIAVLILSGCMHQLGFSTTEDWQALRKDNAEWHQACLDEVECSALDKKGKKRAAEQTNANFEALERYVNWAQGQYPLQMDAFMAQGPKDRCVNMVWYKSDMNWRWVHEGPEDPEERRFMIEEREKQRVAKAMQKRAEQERSRQPKAVISENQK